MIPEHLIKDWKAGERKTLEEYADEQLGGRHPIIQRLLDYRERKRKSKINQAR